MYHSKLIACGGYLPKKILDNNYFEKRLDTSDEWITVRTGIKQRHIAEDGELTSDLAVCALENAFENFNIDKNSIDGIIVATTTPDMVFPGVANTVQSKMQISNNCFAFDLNGVCTGFIHALTVADSLIKSGSAKRIAVIGAETMSRILDWEDRSTVVLFGDGAGAFVLERSEDRGGVIDSEICCDGSLTDILYVPGGPSSNILDGKIQMNGREVFKFAVKKAYEITKQIMERNNLAAEDVDYFIMHQANVRILDAISKKLSLDDSKIVKSVNLHANTSAASIPLAFCKQFSTKLSEGIIPSDKNIIFTGFGAGVSWGSIYFKT